MRIINTEYSVNSKEDKKIVLISDIHYYSKKDLNHLNKVLDKIKKISPNYICIPGDITDVSNILDEEIFINWLTKLSSISKVIISLGNHEYYINKSEKKYGLNKKILDRICNIENIYLLDNKNKIIDNINFIGLTLPINYYHQEEKQYDIFEEYFNNIKTVKNKYNILLCHSPVNIFNLKRINVDLVLCGHMHGGIVPNIFRKFIKHRGFINPSKKIFPKNVYGKIKLGHADIIITSGITVVSHINKFRILKKLFAPEIVTIKLEKK